MKVVARVLPFRVNRYVLDELIDWNKVPNDPMFQLTFPQRDMLNDQAFYRLEAMISNGAPKIVIDNEVRRIQLGLNPHPSGQREHNVPMLEGRALHGMQHKYPETLLFFPSQGQTCHAYCSYCFRWPQFVGLDELKFASREATELTQYLKLHPEITSVLITGGDPLVMKSTVLARYVDPLLDETHGQIASIRIGTKAMAYWPSRFIDDNDAGELLRLFERVVKSGRNLALMAHYTHPRELETNKAQEALRLVLNTGAVVRTQSPVIRYVNDDAKVWEIMWNQQVRLGCVPYYFFVARDTGAQDYFAVPIARALEIYQGAHSRVSGLARTARGPVMSADPGKVVVDGQCRIANEDVFSMRFLQARDRCWVGRPFHANYDLQARWFDQLEPAFGEKQFFYEAQGTIPRHSMIRSRERKRLPLVPNTSSRS